MPTPGYIRLGIRDIVLLIVLYCCEQREDHGHLY